MNMRYLALTETSHNRRIDQPANHRAINELNIKAGRMSSGQEELKLTKNVLSILFIQVDWLIA